MSESDSGTSGGISTLGLLGVVFVVLKLTHTIDWSWWWVTVPFWGPAVLAIAVLVVGVLLIGATVAVKGIWS